MTPEGAREPDANCHFPMAAGMLREAAGTSPPLPASRPAPGEDLVPESMERLDKETSAVSTSSGSSQFRGLAAPSRKCPSGSPATNAKSANTGYLSDGPWLCLRAVRNCKGSSHPGPAHDRVSTSPLHRPTVKIIYICSTAQLCSSHGGNQLTYCQNELTWGGPGGTR
jgi:hypothetical protein